MISKTRADCTKSVQKFAPYINQNGGDVLYVGIAGDPKGGEYASLFINKSITMDIDPIWNPDIVGDITKTSFSDEEWSNIVIVQVIEHIKTIWDLPRELHRILKKNGLIIIDCPWQYPYHAEPPSFGDYWRISIDGFKVLFDSNLFTLEDFVKTENNTSCLFRKK